MKIENPLAFSFIMQDDIYLLNQEKPTFANKVIIPQSVTEETPLLSFNYLGGHKKNFLVVVHYPELEFIAEPHLTALENIFKRLELSLNDVAILNLANYTGTGVEQLNAFFSPQKLLIMGADALPDGIEKLSINLPKKINDCHTLLSFSFDDMMQSNENKKAFWEQMKQL